MSDITYWADEYTREIEQYSTVINYFKSLSDSGNNQLISQAALDCESKINRIKEVKKSYGLELRLVKDKGLKLQHEQNMKTLDERYNELNTKYNDAKNELAKKQLFQKGNTTNIFDTKGKTNEELLSGANVLQDKTEESLIRTRALVEQSKFIGNATIDQLRGQREQIKEIEADIDRIESNMERTERLVLDFTRRMAGDRIIQGFAALNISIMIAVIVYVAVTGTTLSKATSNSFASAVFGTTPTHQPTARPTISPSFIPTELYTGPPFCPTLIPSFRPTVNPSAIFTHFPSSRPSALDTNIPSCVPTITPSINPTITPSAQLSLSPSAVPTSLTTIAPSSQPSSIMTTNPTVDPTSLSSFPPSPIPSLAPSERPTASSSIQPTSAITESPTPAPT